MKKQENIMEMVKSFEDACKLLNIDPGQCPVENCPEKDKLSLMAYYKLVIIIRALNEGWEPNWKNWDERKWYNYFWTESASGFVRSITDYSFTFTSIGARLCFKSRELAEYARKQFEQLYLEFLFIEIQEVSQDN